MDSEAEHQKLWLAAELWEEFLFQTEPEGVFSDDDEEPDSDEELDTNKIVSNKAPEKLVYAVKSKPPLQSNLLDPKDNFENAVRMDGQSYSQLDVNVDLVKEASGAEWSNHVAYVEPMEPVAIADPFLDLDVPIAKPCQPDDQQVEPLDKDMPIYIGINKVNNDMKQSLLCLDKKTLLDMSLTYSSAIDQSTRQFVERDFAVEEKSGNRAQELLELGTGRVHLPGTVLHRKTVKLIDIGRSRDKKGLILCQTLNTETDMTVMLRYVDPKYIRREINQTVDPQVEKEMQSLKRKVATLEEENKKLKLNVESCGQVCKTDDKQTRSSSPVAEIKTKEFQCAICLKYYATRHSLAVHKSTKHRTNEEGTALVQLKTCLDCDKTVLAKNYSGHRKSALCIEKQKKTTQMNSSQNVRLFFPMML